MANVLIRMPDAFLARIDAARAKVEQESGWSIDRTQFLMRVITRGLESLGLEPVPGAPQGSAEDLGYDPERYVLGKLCRQRHDWRGSGQSLLHKGNRTCVECHRAARRKKG